MEVLILDNYDSFTYNLAHLVEKIGGCAFDVIRNDKITVKEAAGYDKILLSPGPGLPSEGGIMPLLIKEYASTKSILGVCLGHQAIGEAFGSRLLNLKTVLHGVRSDLQITDPDEALFKGINNPIKAGHYHSWVIDPESITKDLKITAKSEDGMIMAISHRIFDVKGVQFHPESVLTSSGEQILRNWLLSQSS